MKLKTKHRPFLIFSFIFTLGLISLILNTQAFSQSHIVHVKMLPVRSACASSAESEECAAERAVDNDFTTRWASEHGKDPQWIVIDLGIAKRIKYMVLCWETAAALVYTVDVSMDNENWVEVYSDKTGKAGLTLIPLETHKKARYVRVYGKRRTTQFGYSLFEFQAFGN
jgi:hypothetical protein